MSSPLERLAGPGGSLQQEPPDTREIDGLKRSALARLRDAQNEVNSLESRFDLVYNAAHSISLAALRRCGFRAKNRYVAFQVLPHTVGVGPDVWRVLAKGHEIRNVAEYEGEFDVDERIVADMIAACQAVADRLAAIASS